MLLALVMAGLVAGLAPPPTSAAPPTRAPAAVAQVALPPSAAGPALATADWWTVARCTFSLTLVAGGLYFGGYRWYRAFIAIRAAGGVAAVAEFVLAAGTLAARIAAFERIFGTLTRDLLGISDIQRSCLA